MTQKKKTPTSFHLSLTAKELLKSVSQHHGISQAALLELLLRAEARKEHISPVSL